MLSLKQYLFNRFNENPHPKGTKEYTSFIENVLETYEEDYSNNPPSS